MQYISGYLFEKDILSMSDDIVVLYNSIPTHTPISSIKEIATDDTYFILLSFCGKLIAMASLSKKDDKMVLETFGVRKFRTREHIGSCLWHLVRDFRPLRISFDSQNTTARLFFAKKGCQVIDDDGEKVFLYYDD